MSAFLSWQAMPVALDQRMDGDRASETSTMEGSIARPEPDHTRTASMRLAVRKMLRRSSKTSILQRPGPQKPPHSPSRPLASPASRSEMNLRTIEVASAPPKGFVPYRTLSATMHVSSNNPSSNRNRSPYALEFPRSARLKPLDLGNPFVNPSEPQLRRRKTLPNGLKRESNRSDSGGEPDRPCLPPMFPANALPGPKPFDLDVIAEPVMQVQRRSRSVEGHEGTIRSDQLGRGEIADDNYQQQSSRQAILRASGFTTTASADDTMGSVDSGIDQPLPLAHTPRQSVPASQNVRRSSPRMPELSWTQMTSLESSPHHASDEFAERLCHLEASLQTFQKSFDALSVEREQKAITAQNLEKSLYDHFATNRPARFKVDYTSNPIPDSANGCPDVQSYDRTMMTRQPTPRDLGYVRGGVGVAGPSRPRSHSRPLASNGKTSPTGEHTFRALYEMLVDERSARRKLEKQVQLLTQELLEVRQHVMMQDASWTLDTARHDQPRYTADMSPPGHSQEMYYDAADAPWGVSPEPHMPAPSAFHASFGSGQPHHDQVPRDANKFQFDFVSDLPRDYQPRDIDGGMF